MRRAAWVSEMLPRRAVRATETWGGRQASAVYAVAPPIVPATLPQGACVCVCGVCVRVAQAVTMDGSTWQCRSAGVQETWQQQQVAG